MKTVVNILAVAIFLAVTPSPCFAAWDVEIVTRDRAKELGMEVRSKAVGFTDVQVTCEFKPVGELKNFSRVDLKSGKGAAARLQEDRSKPGRIVVSFTVERTQLGKLNLRVMVPGTLGGAVYDLPVKDFVELKKD